MYRGLLVGVPAIRADALKLVVNMMVHPIPAVRSAAAETVVSICGDGEMVDGLVKMDFTRPAGEVKEVVVEIRKAVDEGTFVVVGGDE